MNAARARTHTSLLGALLVLVLVAVGCSSSSDQDESSPAPGILHVHGLGIDPADSTLYAATHYGLFRVPDNGSAQRIGDNYQDTMGFTVVGPNRFLGSGHPDLQQSDLPPLLGLIESTNAGRKWEPLSLLGEADFHALSFRHDTVYGYDATNQRFMVSTDRETWETRSEPPGVISFAVDPNDPEHVIATTSSGLLVSTDGGRTWRDAAPAPLAFVSWADDGTLVGAGADRAVYVSSDRGATWSGAGRLLGLPEALLVVDSRTLVAAVQERGLYDSTDGGHTWELRYRDAST